MSVLLFFAVYDKKVEAFDKPLVFRSKGEAMRAFIDACEKDENFKAHPEDFAFAFVGRYDDVAGHIEGLESGPEFVIQALEAVRSKEVLNRMDKQGM